MFYYVLVKHFAIYIKKTLILYLKNKNMYSEKDLDDLINISIKETELPYVSSFSLTESGFERISNRVKEHILEQNVPNVDTALAMVEDELSTPNV